MDIGHILTPYAAFGSLTKVLINSDHIAAYQTFERFVPVNRGIVVSTEDMAFVGGFLRWLAGLMPKYYNEKNGMRQ